MDPADLKGSTRSAPSRAESFSMYRYRGFPPTATHRLPLAGNLGTVKPLPVSLVESVGYVKTINDRLPHRGR
jgi:hypothetical protein